MYEDDTGAFQNTDYPSHHGQALRITQTGYDDTKKKASSAPVQMLRQLYPEVDLWGDLLRRDMPRAP